MSENDIPKSTENRMGWATHRKPPPLVAGLQDTLPAALQHVQAEVAEMLRMKLHQVIDGSIQGTWDLSKGQKDFLVQWAMYCVANGQNCSRTLAAGALHVLREVEGKVPDADERILKRTFAMLEKNEAIASDATIIKTYLMKTRQALLEAERAAEAKQAEEDAKSKPQEAPANEQKPGIKLSETVQRIRSAMVLQNHSRAAEIARTALHESSNDIPTLIACATALQNHGMDPSIKNPFARLADVIKAIETFKHALLLLDVIKNPKTQQMIQQSLAKLQPACEKLEEDTKRKKP